MAWEWTKFICCNRPIESVNDRGKQQQPNQLHNHYKPTEVVILDQQYNKIYEEQNSNPYHQQQPLSTSSLYSFSNHEHNNRLAASSSNAEIVQNLENCENNKRSVNRSLRAHTNGVTPMDGIRVQLSRRKSGGPNGSGSGFRSPPVQRSDQLQVTLRGWLYRLEGAAIKQWKRRWFVLGEYCLFNYKDTDEEKLIGSILLPSYRVSPCLASEDGITRKYAFKLEHQNMKTYFLAADSKESMTQWMNALSLASIMQVNALKSPLSGANSSPNSSCPPRNRPDGQDVDYSQKSERDDAREEDEEEESGFVSYKPRRLVSASTSNSYLGSGDKYPGSYNSVGLPTISYPTTANYQHQSQHQYLAPQQKRSHYANAPPKPRRQQTGDTIYDYSDNYHVKNYSIPPGAQYHQSHLTGSGPAPDLIAHNTTTNGNYLPALNYAGFFAPHRNHLNNRHTERTNVTSPLSSPSSPTSSNAHYSALPVSRLNSSHHEPLQSYIAPPSQFRLLTRPHSADFLERDHEDESAVDNEVFYDRRQQYQTPQQQQYQQQSHYISTKQHLQESQHAQPGGQAQQQAQAQLQQRTSEKIPPLRSKSSLERYDPYYYKYYESQYGQAQAHPENMSATQQSISSVTSPPHRPWSDYLQQQSQRESSDRNSAAAISPSISSSASSTAISGRQKPQMSANMMVPDIPKKSQQNQLQREESLQRLLEWKQHGNGEIPARPPLPKEYKTKVSMMYKGNEEGESSRKETVEPSMPRERSKSFGNVHSGSNDVSYSSDDEGNPTLTMPEPSARRRKRHQSGKNVRDADRNSPEYMNISSFQNSCEVDSVGLDVRSGGDGQEDDRNSTSIANIEKLYQSPIKICRSVEEPSLKRTDSYNNLSCVGKSEEDSSESSSQDKEFGSICQRPEALTRGHLRVSFRSALKSSPTGGTKGLTEKTKLPPTPPPKPLKAAHSGDENLKTNSKATVETSSDKPSTNVSYENPLEDDSEEDVISKLVKFYNAQKTRPAPNFVRDRIKSIEMESQTLSKYRFKSGSGSISYGISSDTELMESKKQEEDNNTTKSAPVTFSSLSSVLADLRKTADARKEQLYIEEKEQPNSNVEKPVENSDAITSCNYDEDVPKDDVIGSSDSKINDEEDHGYLTMESKLSGNGDDVYVPMSPFVNEANKEDSSAVFDYENDAGADADDEASRDFDSIQYQNEVLKASCSFILPLDAQSNENLMRRKAREADMRNQMVLGAGFIDPDGFNSCESESQESLKPTSHYSSFLSQSWIKDLLNPNPAYECLGSLRVCTDPVTVTGLEMMEEKKSPSNAPYYYSDLLTEAERESLDHRLAAAHLNSPPPSLLSRCSALNNTKYLGTTSLQKVEIGKKVNQFKAQETSSFTPSLSPAVVTAPVRSVLDLIPDDYSVKFKDAGRNEYVAGSTLQKVSSSEKEDLRQEIVKRCLTPDTLETTTAISERNAVIEARLNVLRRRSRSLTNLNLECDPVYENVDAFMEPKDKENATNEDERINVPLLESINNNNCFDLEDRNTRKPIENVDSDKGSIIELGGSQTGSFYEQKVRRRRSSRSSRSKDDLNNVSDSETASKPPPPPPLPIGYNEYGYPYYNLNESLKHQQKLSRSVGTGLQYQDPDPLRSRLCVSAGDLIGKSHEELVLLLIQMRRNQSHLASTCDQLRLQMESEEKLIEIEPYKREEHKARFRELRDKLVEAEREYNLRFPVINMIDNMVKLNYGTNTGSVQELADNKDEEDLLRDKSASTSFLDKLPEKREERKDERPKDASERLSDEGVTNLKKTACSPSSSSSSSSSDIEKMKKQQNMLESELGRVRGLLVQSAKRLEERAAENAKMEQDMMVAKTKLNQVLCSPSSSSTASYTVDNHLILEAELESIDKAIDDLHAKRKEILESYRKNKMETAMIVRASPTGLAGSAPLPEKKKRPATSYLETDIDSMESRDLAQYFYLRYLINCDGDPGNGIPLYENLESHVLYNLEEKKEFGNHEKGNIINGESGA